MDDNLKKEIQSATLERLIKHLDERKEYQILMQGSIFMECPTLNGKKNTRSNFLFNSS